MEPKQFGPLDGRHIELKYGYTHYLILAYIFSSIAPRTNIQVSIPMLSMSGNILALSDVTSENPVLDFKIAPICFTLLRILLAIAHRKKNNTRYPCS